jgi:hypothetical protein
MIEIGFFYLLLLLLILILLLVSILYAGGHKRIIVPPLLNNYYGVSTSTANITTSWQPLILSEEGGLNFDTSAISSAPFEFIPLSKDRQRNISGKVLMNAVSQGTSVWFSLRLKDNDTIISEATNFILYPEAEKSLQNLNLVFNTSGTSIDHKFILEAKARSPTETLNGTSILLNGAYLTYI